MANLIKNIPEMGFGLHGNRGLGFPILGHLSESFNSLFFTDQVCELETELTDLEIISDDGKTVLVVCADVVDEVRQPNIDCYLGSQEDPSLTINQQEGFPIIVQCID